MKFIHLSDLHIGKRVHEFSMIEDQKYILQQILHIVKEEKADAVIIAGDIYDKTVPSAEAVQVLDSFLTELANWEVMVFAISGNHDSAERIAFGSQLMASRKIYISPVYDGRIQKIKLQDAYGEINVHLLPFLKPAMVRQALVKQKVYMENEDGNLQKTDMKVENWKIETYQDALAAVIGEMDVDSVQRNVLVAHQFVTGAKCCDSEELQVGGVDQISVDLFVDFDYVALGHIHSPQKIGRDTVRYCGTPLKYSFSEADQTKSVTVVEMKGKGTVELRTIDLKPLKDMRKVKGKYIEVTSFPYYKKEDSEDYVQITLTDEEDIVDVLQKLRYFYPNLMHLEYDNIRTRENQDIAAVEEVEQKSELEILEEFYQLQNNQSMEEEQREFSRALIEKLLQ